MPDISDVFNNGRKAFIPFITAGYPDRSSSVEIGIAAARNGGDIIEIGIPFSDSLADGPVIQTSFQKALEKGITVREGIETAGDIHARSGKPVVVMVSLNLVIRNTAVEFASLCRANGISGIIIPDLPPEYAEKEISVFKNAGIDMIFLVAPNTPAERMKLIAGYTSGYLYCVARLGTTGGEICSYDAFETYFADIRSHIDIPLCAGFGISSPDDVREVGRYADGVIVGSALIRIISACMPDKEKMLQHVSDYARSMKCALGENT